MSPIPKIRHNIWIQGYDNLPKLYIECIENSNKVFIDYEYMFWDDDKICKLLSEKFPEIFEKYSFCTINAQKSDIARLCILYEYGGIYYDVDFTFFKNIDIFLNCDLFCVTDDTYGFFYKAYNGMVGVIPRNGIILEFINTIINTDNDKLNIGIDILNTSSGITNTTGLTAFYNIIKNNYDKNIYSIKIINKIYLFPITLHNNIAEHNWEQTQKYVFASATNNTSWISPEYSGLINIFANINSKIHELKINNEPVYFLSNKVVKKKYHKNYDNLIVTAHPDDELLFFGDFLINNANNSTVLCVSNSSNFFRRNEFMKVMETLQCNYIMWDFKDCQSYSTSPELKNKLAEITKKYKNIYTHSLSGETGHPQHILINMYLDDIVKKNLFVANLNIFKSHLSEKKKELLFIYITQYYPILLYLNKTSQEDYLQIK